MGRIPEFLRGLLLIGAIFGLVFAVAFMSRGCNPLRQLSGNLGGRLVVDFRELPGGDAVSAVLRLDTDSDGWEEWVVSYKYDVGTSNFPISCVVYDLVGDPPFTIRPYQLTTPNHDYLGENAVSVVVEDILPDPPGETRPELIVADGRTLSIFRVQPKAANPYLCEGFFRGNLSVSRSGATVVVLDRAGSERSQFALRRVYAPTEGSYFLPGTGTLRPPVEASIEFAFGLPQDILDTPYPEKLVLAFYKQLKVEGADPKVYLTAQAQQRFAAGQLAYGSPWPLEQVSKVLVQEISYIPGPADMASATAPTAQPMTAEVQVKVLFVRPGEARLREVRWYLIRQDNRWKMHEAVSG